MPMIDTMKVAIGTIDGTNLDFSTPDPYIAGSLRVLYNGQWKKPEDDDGYTETGTDTFTMKEPPLIEDGLLVAYEAA